MHDIFAAKTDDFSIATDGCMVIVTTVLSQETLHEPCLGEIRRNVENPIKKDLCDLPAFL